MAALEINEARRAIKGEIDLLAIKQVKDGDIVFAEAEMLEGFSKRFRMKEKI